MPLIDDLRGALAGRPEVSLAVLFGSSVRSGGPAGADVDIALQVSPRDPVTLGELTAALGRAARRPVDVVHLDEAPPLLRFEVARSGVLLAERRTGSWADFRARAMLDWWDWAPTVRRLWAAARDRLHEKVSRGAA